MMWMPVCATCTAVKGSTLKLHLNAIYYNTVKLFQNGQQDCSGKANENNPVLLQTVDDILSISAGRTKSILILRFRWKSIQLIQLEETKKGLRIRREVRLVEPIDQMREYDRIIKMLEMSMDDIIKRDERGFSQYVMDDWSWKANFLETTNPYTKG